MECLIGMETKHCSTTVEAMILLAKTKAASPKVATMKAGPTERSKMTVPTALPSSMELAATTTAMNCIQQVGMSCIERAGSSSMIVQATKSLTKQTRVLPSCLERPSCWMEVQSIEEDRRHCGIPAGLSRTQAGLSCTRARPSCTQAQRSSKVRRKKQATALLGCWRTAVPILPNSTMAVPMQQNLTKVDPTRPSLKRAEPTRPN